MLWRVSLVTCSDGSEPDERWAKGFIVRDRRAGAFDLIAKVNADHGTVAHPGEVYDITPLRDQQRYRVNDDGTLSPV